MASESRSRRWAYVPVFVVALAAIILKVNHWYYSRPLWLDEEMLLLNIRDRAFASLAGPLWLDQTAPLGWLVLQRLLLLVVGSSDRAVRALPVLFGIGTVVSAAWVGLRWMRPAGAAMFVLLCGFTQWTMFYALEAKPYAADAFWALLLPSLAVWAVEQRRPVVWWLVATVGQWMSYGATFVAPGSALLLLTLTWHRDGRQQALRTALQGVIWVVNFSLHYFLVMRHARASGFLADFWASGLLPPDATFVSAMRWIIEQAEPLASHPGGTARWFFFWLIVGYGLAISLRERPALALSWLIVPLSAALLAVLRLVPLKDRLAFWIVPALYAAIAAAAADSLHRGREWLMRNNLRSLGTATLAMLVVWPFCLSLIEPAQVTLAALRGPDNHGFDDRTGLHFLMDQSRPGDAYLATHFTLPGVWWYGRISIAEPTGGSALTEGGAPIYQLEHQGPDHRICRAEQPHLQSTLESAQRAVVYLGFDSLAPEGFQQLVLDELSEFATLVDYRHIGSLGAAAIFDLHAQPSEDAIFGARKLWHGMRPRSRLRGCVDIHVARRWTH